MAGADEAGTHRTEARVEKYVDNALYCLKHKINVGGPVTK
jgi:hypothetical protein